MRKRELSEKDDLIMSRPRLQCSGTIKFLCLYNAHTYNLYICIYAGVYVFVFVFVFD